MFWLCGRPGLNEVPSRDSSLAGRKEGVWCEELEGWAGEADEMERQGRRMRRGGRPWSLLFCPSPTSPAWTQWLAGTCSLHTGASSMGAAPAVFLSSSLLWIFFSFLAVLGTEPKGLALTRQAHSTTEPHPLLPASDVFCQPSPAPKSSHSLSLKATFLAHTSARLTSRLPFHTLPSPVTSTKQPPSSSWAFV